MQRVRAVPSSVSGFSQPHKCTVERTGRETGGRVTEPARSLVPSQHETIAPWKHTGKLSAGLRLIATKAVCGLCFGVGEPAEGNVWCVIKLKGGWSGSYFFRLEVEMMTNSSFWLCGSVVPGKGIYSPPLISF